MVHGQDARVSTTPQAGYQSSLPRDDRSPARDCGSIDEVYCRCRELGMRLSRQRRMVLDLLWAEKSHLSARDIFEKLNNLGRNIGHTSVYQNLEALQTAGVIECLDRANGRLYGYRSTPHSHLTCLETGVIQDLDLELPEELLSQIEEKTGFRIEAYSVDLSGRPSQAVSENAGTPSTLAADGNLKPPTA